MIRITNIEILGPIPETHSSNKWMLLVSRDTSLIFAICLRVMKWGKDWSIAVDTWHRSMQRSRPSRGVFSRVKVRCLPAPRSMSRGSHVLQSNNEDKFITVSRECLFNNRYGENNVSRLPIEKKSLLEIQWFRTITLSDECWIDGSNLLSSLLGKSLSFRSTALMRMQPV